LTALEECVLTAGEKTGCERNRSEMDPLILLATEHTFIRSGDQLNGRPRQTLGFKTPSQALAEVLR